MLDTLAAACHGLLTKSDTAPEVPADDPSGGAPTDGNASDEAHGRVDLAGHPTGDAAAGPGSDD